MADEFAPLKAIFRAALDRVDPYAMVLDHLRVEGGDLVVEAEGRLRRITLGGRRIVVLGAGKAAARMARGLEDRLGPRITGGLVVVKRGHGEPLTRIDIVEAGHPTPDADGVAAAGRIAALAREADRDTLVLCVISGGGSALLPAPLAGLTLADKQAVTNALLASGADIDAINCVRKHLSALKGGRLLSLLAPAQSVTLIVSDVIGDRLDTIASGLTVPDPTTFAEARAILERFDLCQRVPAAVVKALTLGAAGLVAETLKPGDPAAALAESFIIGSNRTAVLAARDHAAALGYPVVMLDAPLTGEARAAGQRLFALARERRDTRRPVCLLAGGETVVRVTGAGRGGRNQELALAFLAEMARDPQSGHAIRFVSAATDGGDGPTDAAGAFASSALLAATQAGGLSIEAALRDNDSYTFFDRIGGLLRTGPTLTNVCDLQIVLVDRPL